MKKLYARKIRELCVNPEACAKTMRKAFQPSVDAGLMSTQNVDTILRKLSESGFYTRLGDITESISLEKYEENELLALIEMYTKCPSIVEKMPEVSVEINIRVNQALAELEMDKLLENTDD